jgi:hypothetical protein
MLSLAAMVYCCFFVPIGQRTLYAHISRIAATREARELGSAVSELVADAKAALSSRL